MAIQLHKGQGINLSKDHGHVRNILVDVSWDVNTRAVTREDRFELGVSAFLLVHQNGKPVAEEDGDFVFYNNLSDPTGSVKHEKDNPLSGRDAMLIDLDTLFTANNRIDEISIIAEIYEGQKRRQDFGHVNHATAEIIDKDTGEKIAFFKLTEDDSGSTAVQMGSFVRENGDWHFKAVGTGYNKGLAAFLNVYGLVANDEE
jgi:tellurium resistance protein TerD